MTPTEEIAVTSLTTVYERQQAAYDAQRNVSSTYEDIYWDLEPKARHQVNVYEHPDVVKAQAIADKLTAEVAVLREQVGGRVFRVVNAKLTELQARIEKLNKKAVKLGTDPITLVISDEHDQIKRMVITDQDSYAALGFEPGINGYDEIIDFTFVTVNGPTPMLPGFVFVATLDHDTDDSDSVGVRRAPVGTGLASQIGEDAAKAVEAADLTAYRHGKPDCDHCKWDRKRKQTYVLYEVATGQMRQIGTNCVKDYIPNANNPEKVAAWAEWMQALYADLGIGGDDGFGDIGVGSGRVAIPTQGFLDNVAAMIREFGWTPRWNKDGYGEFSRNYSATADRAKDNYLERDEKLRKPVLAEDMIVATKALTWVRDDLAERDELNEYEHNLVTYAKGDYLPEKGDGFVASAIGAYQRELQRKLEAEKVANSEWIGAVGDRVKGLTWTVTFIKAFDGDYGTRWLTKGYDVDGNQIVWWGAGGIDQGVTITCSATVKKHDTDKYNGGSKVTQIGNVRSIKVIESEPAQQ